jgi:hypothetical protein
LTVVTTPWRSVDGAAGSKSSASTPIRRTPVTPGYTFVISASVRSDEPRTASYNASEGDTFHSSVRFRIQAIRVRSGGRRRRSTSSRSAR